MDTIKFVLVFVLFIQVYGANAKIDESSDNNFTVINYHLDSSNFSSQIIKTTDDFIKLKLPGVNYQQIIGRPELPMLNVLLITENHHKNGEDIIIEKNKVKFTRDGRLSFFKGQKCRCRQIEDFQFDENIYISNQQDFWVEDFGDYRGKKVLRLNVVLGKQNERSFELTTGIQIKIPKHYKKLDTQIYLNDKKRSRSTLIIGKIEYRKLLNSYVDRMKTMGRNGIIEFIDTKVETQTIKELINKHYNSNGIDNVILVGNDQVIPTYYVDTKFDSQTPSDYQYGLMGGEEDMIPDVFISRLPISNKKQLSNVLSKFKVLGEGLNIKRLLGISSNEGSNPSDFEYMRSIINPLSKSRSASALFLDQDNLNSNRDSFNSELQNGVDFISYIGHGSGFSWPSFNDEYVISDLELVDDQKRFPVLIDIACQNGRFSGEGRIGENFFLGGDDNRLVGASLYYGGSVDISWHPPAVMTVGISEFISSNNNVPIDKALTYGHFYLMNTSTPKEDIIDNLEWYHLQGDPGIIIL